MIARSNPWLHRFAWLTACATYLLLLAGATVTSHRAGLSVPDWPTTYGQFMFSFPRSKWVGGIFYEHGHRLIASTVGMLTVVLSVWLVSAEPRRWVRRLGIAALAAVIAQGILGGLTVKLFLPPSVSIAHAGLAETFFCITIALAMATSAKWVRDGSVVLTKGSANLKRLAVVTTVLVYIQLMLGAAIRHANVGVMAHIVGAVLVTLMVLVLAMNVLRCVQETSLKRHAFCLPLLVAAQIGVGVATFMVRVPKSESGQLDPIQVIVPTIHMAIGALILAVCFSLTIRICRFLAEPASADTTANPQSRNLFRAYVDLAKPRIVSMVLVTTTLGFFVAGRGIHSLLLLIVTLLGVGSATGGAAVLNNYLEREVDGRMVRTRNRALPAGIISPSSALAFGICLMLAGLFLLVWRVNLLTGFLVLLAGFLYVLVYTPMKRLTWFNTTVGAIPGAIPPMCGWAAATGRLDVGSWILFAILFAWQHPHFYAIAWMFKDDYQNAGFKMLPVVDPSGRSTFRQTLLYSGLLIGVSLLPTAIGMTGKIYCYGALIMGLGLFSVGVLLTRTKTFLDAKRLLKASVIYLPLLLLLIIVDAGF